MNGHSVTRNYHSPIFKSVNGNFIEMYSSLVSYGLIVGHMGGAVIKSIKAMDS